MSLGQLSSLVGGEIILGGGQLCSGVHRILQIPIWKVMALHRLKTPLFPACFSPSNLAVFLVISWIRA
jgi:hypothetical protein